MSSGSLVKGYTHNQGGRFALGVAASNGHLEVVKLLLDKVSDVNQENKVSVCVCVCAHAFACVCVLLYG